MCRERIWIIKLYKVLCDGQIKYDEADAQVISLLCVSPVTQFIDDMLSVDKVIDTIWSMFHIYFS